VTVLLVLTSSGDATADYLLGRLKRYRSRIFRIDTDRMVENIQIGLSPQSAWLWLSGLKVDAGEISSIWLRRPKPITVPKHSDEGEDFHTAGEWAESLENLLAFVPRERWFNHPSANAAASRKLIQLHHAKRLGLLVPETVLTQDPEVIRALWERHEGRVVVKPLNSGCIEREDGRMSLIYTNNLREHHLAAEDLIRACPVLYQEEIAKEVDVRVTWVDGRVIAVSMRNPGPTEIDIRRDNMAHLEYGTMEIPAVVETGIRALMAHFGLRFAAIDFGVKPTGEWVFFEINPNGQWAWLDLAGGMDLWRLFESSFFPG
jgi:hypothetical protein